MSVMTEERKDNNCVCFMAELIIIQPKNIDAFNVFLDTFTKRSLFISLNAVRKKLLKYRTRKGRAKAILDGNVTSKNKKVDWILRWAAEIQLHLRKKRKK